MYTDMEDGAEIRRRVLVDGLSRRAARRECGLHRKALEEILAHAEPPAYRRPLPERPSILEPLPPAVHRILEDDTKAPRERRHTAVRIGRRLRDEHGDKGGLTVVKEAIRAGRRGHAEVFVRLAHPPGEAQVAFGAAEVTPDGRPTKVALFVMRPPYSGALFRGAFPRECTEASLEGHVRAFAFLGGVPRRIGHDDLEIAVARITGGRGRTLTDAFLRPKGHHLSEPHSRPARRPNEKGHVETLVGFARRSFLVPVPAPHGGLEGLDARPEADRRADLWRRPRGQPATEAGRIAEERAAMRPLPAEAFVAARVERPHADPLSLVRFATNDYSAPTQSAHRRVTVVGAVDTARIAVGEGVVAAHRRSWGREGVTYDPVHYLALPGRKPGALDFAAPLAGWELPVRLGVPRRRWEAESGGPGTRRSIQALRLPERASPEELTRAVGRALELGTVAAAAVRLALEHRGERPAGLFRLDGRPHPRGDDAPIPDLSAYAGPAAGVRP